MGKLENAARKMLDGLRGPELAQPPVAPPSAGEAAVPADPPIETRAEKLERRERLLAQARELSAKCERAREGAVGSFGNLSELAGELRQLRLEINGLEAELHEEQSFEEVGRRQAALGIPGPELREPSRQFGSAR